MNFFSRSAAKSPFAGVGAAIAKKLAEDKKDDDDDNVDGDTGDEGDDDDKKKKTKKKQKAEDEQDEQDEEDPEARAARAREKARIYAIVSSKAALHFPDAAMTIALNSTTPRHQAIATLSSIAAELTRTGARDTLRDRMAAIPQVDIGAGGGEQPAPGDPKVFAAAIIAANKKALGDSA